MMASASGWMASASSREPLNALPNRTKNSSRCASRPASTACGLLICVIISFLFLDDTANLPLDRYIAGMFVLAMVALIASFIFLLREVFVSFRYMRMHLHLHDAPPQPPR